MRAATIPFTFISTNKPRILLVKMRYFRKLLLGIVALIVVATPGIARATSLDVSAAVPFDPPTEAAVINSPTNGGVTDTQSLLVSGTCGVIEPAAIVSIWRGNQSLGSTTCMSGGIFSLSVQLVEGVNQIVARTSNISLQYGPDSTPVSITYIAPTAPSNTGGTTTQTPPVTTLNITSEHTFRVITDDDSEVVVRITVDGGKTPYTIVVTWGDGSQDTRLASEPGAYEFRHTYDKVQLYRVVIDLTDVLGTSTSYTLPVVPSTVAPQITSQTTTPTPTKSDDHAWWWVIAVGIVLLVALAFYAGERYRDKTARAERREIRRQNRHKSKKPALSIGIIFFLAASALLALYLWMVQPSNVVVESPNLITVAGATDTTEKIETTYYSAMIPESLTKKSGTENPNGTVLSQALYAHSKTTIADQLAITVGVAETNSVRDLSAVQARQQDPVLYQLSSTPEAPSGSLTYVRNSDGKYERGVYWIQDGHFAMVVVSGTTERIAELHTALGTVLRTWQWRN